jgi:hypothetical protein
MRKLGKLSLLVAGLLFCCPLTAIFAECPAAADLEITSAIVGSSDVDFDLLDVLQGAQNKYMCPPEESECSTAVDCGAFSCGPEGSPTCRIICGKGYCGCLWD